MSSLELTLQVSVLVGGSMLLYWSTAPGKEESEEEYKMEHSKLPELQGMKRYSSHHRQRHARLQRAALLSRSRSSSSYDSEESSASSR